MNFNILINFFICILLLCSFLGCGVKARPLEPKETAIQSYLDSYLHHTKLEDEAKKNVNP